jgi:hypothetical protein
MSRLDKAIGDFVVMLQNKVIHCTHTMHSHCVFIHCTHTMHSYTVLIHCLLVYCVLIQCTHTMHSYNALTLCANTLLARILCAHTLLIKGMWEDTIMWVTTDNGGMCQVR